MTNFEDGIFLTLILGLRLVLQCNDAYSFLFPLLLQEDMTRYIVRV